MAPFIFPQRSVKRIASASCNTSCLVKLWGGNSALVRFSFNFSTVILYRKSVQDWGVALIVAPLTLNVVIYICAVHLLSSHFLTCTARSSCVSFKAMSTQDNDLRRDVSQEKPYQMWIGFRYVYLVCIHDFNYFRWQGIQKSKSTTIYGALGPNTVSQHVRTAVVATYLMRS